MLCNKKILFLKIFTKTFGEMEKKQYLCITKGDNKYN